MAKAKKTESTENAAKPAAPKKTAKTRSAPPAGTPMVNTSFAAEAAAKMLASGLKSSAGPSSGTASGTTESSLFKQIKANVAKPHVSGLENVLDQSAPAESKKSNVPFGGPGSGKQVGHNQTFGADVNRSGVPRRTAG